MRTTVFLVLAVVLFVLLSGLASFYLLRIRKQSKTSWAELMDRLIVVNRENLALVAHDLLDERVMTEERTRIELDPSEIWDLVGGMEGLAVLEKNCDVLIDMASYVQQWHPEAIVIAEQLRNNAREVKWHIDRLRGSLATGNLRSSFPDYAQRAVAIYFTMTQHLLTLYSTFELPVLAELQQVF